MLSHSPDLPRTHSGVLQTLKRSESNLRRTLIPIDSPTCNRRFSCSLKLSDSDVSWRGSTTLRRNLFRIGNMDEDSVGISSLDEWEYGDSEEILESNSYILSSSEDISDGTIAVTADRLGVLRKRRRVYRIQPGVFITTGLVVFLVMLLLFVDWWSWRIVKLPLKSFFLTQPFFVSAIVTSFSGFIFVPLLNSLKIHQIFRNEGPVTHSTRKRRTPTMGGLFFIPVGISVARAVAGLSSVEVSGVAVATIAFAVIGLLDDISSFIKNHNYGLPAWLKLFLEVAVGISFWFWLDSTHISSPYSMRMLVPLPSPLGLIYLGKLYPILTAFCFVSMGNGVNLTDGLDGLAGGTVALAFIGMSIAVLPICSDIAIFGASMAGACVGFLMHNRYKASVFMGDVGSLALGGALAAMATCTGMFFPLFISSGVFVLEALSVILQVSHFKMTKRLYGAGRRLFRMSPLHHHLELCGIREQFIVTMAYFISSALAILAGYVGLVSA
ncbi:phospho-N-acetylmuramoyl-pentapeptide-transferase homolog isoform X2 [Macadamia integrifolia]|uniref:phospho-N-acetylmuramoyl-pentapeptide- transferase homolog isoform X2 n=1 Tax=Macadamia integrifolia TaxID=60698 RepID=UPI001C52C753|nr:phospho-N-acetylmuramoyl-pentapeptide-transferase homolog isoform X2 [Macadamia integrifolia]